MRTQQRVLCVYLHNNDVWGIHVAGNNVTYLLLHKLDTHVSVHHDIIYGNEQQDATV